MIDLLRIEQYRENNRIEAKKALGGLPRSIWETYSAFANTLGGMILLGVEEHRDHSLHPVDLPAPELLAEEFWEILNDPKKVSVNILTSRHVQIEQVEGKRILVITVPRAQRYDRPVYVDGNPLTGTYRRSGEGDYRCTPEEVRGMMRDAAVSTQDMRLLSHVEMEALDRDTLRRYRARMADCRPGHVWESLGDEDFLYKLGAAGKDAAGALHPTAAGLLMFGYEYEIIQEFPAYFLDYQALLGPNGQRTGRLTSCSGDWSGNLYDFYFRVCDHMLRNFSPGERAASARDALGEALANTLINADYWGRQGIVVTQCRDRIVFSNPGAFRIRIESARSGGVSDPRNAALSRMFNLISVGERSGSGIPQIYSIWKELGLASPSISEFFSPDRTTFTLPLCRPSGRRPAGPRQRASGEVRRQMIIAYLTDRPAASASEIASYIDLKPSRTRDYLHQLMAADIIISRGSGRSRVYALKS